MIYAILFVAFLVSVASILSRYEREDREESDDCFPTPHPDSSTITTDMDNNSSPNTRQLVVNALTALGCQPNVEGDDTVFVTFQGEHFEMQVIGSFIQIWDPAWARVESNDPGLPKIREAINLTNFDFGPTVVLTRPDESGAMYMHSRMSLLIHPHQPELDQYMRCALNMFFTTKESSRRNYGALVMEQQQHASAASSRRRPVGFAAGQADDTDGADTDSTEQ